MGFLKSLISIFLGALLEKITEYLRARRNQDLTTEDIEAKNKEVTEQTEKAVTPQERESAARSLFKRY